MDIEPDGAPPHDQKPLSSPPEAVAPPAGPAKSSPPRSGSGRRLIPYALLGILTVGAAIAAFFSVRDDRTPSDAVASALTHSLQLKSAAVTTSVRVSEAVGSATITAAGKTSFVTAATDEVVQIASGNERIGERVISDGPTIYVHLDGGMIARLAAGKSWVSVSNGQSASGGLGVSGGAGNTAAILRVLSANGNNVSDLGLAQVSGAAVHLYAVHLTRTQITQDLGQERLPQFMRQELAAVHIPAITYTLAINGSNQLTQLKATLPLRIGGQQVTEHIAEGYSDYGTKVMVTAPPSREVIPLQKFLQIAEAKGQQVTL